jgi:hypothetical protein
MVISLLLLVLIASGGVALTYVMGGEKPLMWRLAAGSAIGSAIFGLIVFVAACIFGLSIATVLPSLAITLLPLVLLRRRDIRASFAHDVAKARGKLQGVDLKKSWAFAYYAFFFVLFVAFFSQAMYETAAGIFTGGSQNLGDLPFHLGAIFSFTDGANFPPQNPSWAGAKFSYPFMADLVTAAFVVLGAGVREAMFVQNVAWAFSLLVVLERFVGALTASRLAGRIAPFVFFFCGGLGFLWFFSDVSSLGRSAFDLLWQLPRDYTIGEQFRWGNSMVVLFITQRSLLLGMPIAILVLGYLWKVFTGGDPDASGLSPLLRPFLFGLVAGTLPLIHLHSLAALFVVTAFLFALRPARWKLWIAFGAGVCVIAVPELIWSITGSASETTKFFEWHFGWDNKKENFLWFWLKNTGIVIPLIAAAIWLLLSRSDAIKPGKKQAKATVEPARTRELVLFYIPFAGLFVISNVAKLAPWEWDNIKVLIYWFVGSLPLIAYALSWAWNRAGAWRVGSAVCLVFLTFSGALDVWRTASGQIKSRVFDVDAIRVAEQIKAKTAPRSLFLNAPTYNSAVVLSGRQSLMRYSGHLSSHGIDYLPREGDVRHIYQGGGVAEVLLRKYDIEYVLVSPEERNTLQANEQFFQRFPVTAESGEYRVYKVK